MAVEGANIDSAECIDETPRFCSVPVLLGVGGRAGRVFPRVLVMAGRAGCVAAVGYRNAGVAYRVVRETAMDHVVDHAKDRVEGTWDEQEEEHAPQRQDRHTRSDNVQDVAIRNEASGNSAVCRSNAVARDADAVRNRNAEGRRRCWVEVHEMHEMHEMWDEGRC